MSRATPHALPLIHFYHPPFSLPDQHSKLFSHSVIYLINPPLSRSTYRTNFHTLPPKYTLTNPIILHSFSMAESSVLSSTPFVTLHSSLIREFDTLSVLFIPNKPLKLSICITLLLYFSFSLQPLPRYLTINTRNTS